MQKMKVCNSRNGMALNKTSLSMRPWLAADDDEIKFSERAIGGIEPLPVSARCGRSHRPHGYWKSRDGWLRF
jgi:hypothetical protein